MLPSSMRSVVAAKPLTVAPCALLGAPARRTCIKNGNGPFPPTRSRIGGGTPQAFSSHPLNIRNG